MINYKTKAYAVQIDEERGEILSLWFGGREYIKHSLPLFVLGWRDSDGELSTMSTFETDFVRKDGNDLYYKNDECEVKAELCLGEKIALRVSVKNNGERALEYIETGICLPEELARDKYKILWGFNEGTLVDNFEMRKTMGFYEPEYPGMGLMPMFPAIVETQFMAYFNEDDGLYMASHDNNDNLKAVDFVPYRDGIKMYLRLYTGSEFGADYEMEYYNILKPYKGGWIEAAQIYRDWFEENKKSSFVKIKDNDKLPDWYRESPIVVTYPVRGHHDMDMPEPNNMFPYINGLKTVEDIAEKTESKIMALLMHWEGSAPWAPPYVWPPYGGEEAFGEYVDELHKRGHLLGVYCSGISYTMQSNLIDEYNCEKEYKEKNLEKHMCISPKGVVEISKVCPDQRSGYDMCPTSKFATNVLKREAASMIASGLDYIQLLDQNHGGTSYFCYGREHGHPPVPGKWQVDAVNEMLGDITKKSKVLLGCESAAAESYIPNLQFSDNRFNLAYWIGVPVPAYAYVYHEYVNNFMGNQVNIHYSFDYERYPENLLMRMAYSFCAGDMLTFVLNDKGEIAWNWGYRKFDTNPDNDKLIEFARMANKFRQKGAKYLNVGKMIKPLDFDFGQNIITETNGFDIAVDKVMTSRWEAEDGTWAQFFVNYNNYDMIKEIDTDAKVISPDERSGLFGNRFVIRSGAVVMMTNDSEFSL